MIVATIFTCFLQGKATQVPLKNVDFFVFFISLHILAKIKSIKRSIVRQILYLTTGSIKLTEISIGWRVGVQNFVNIVLSVGCQLMQV